MEDLMQAVTGWKKDVEPSPSASTPRLAKATVITLDSDSEDDKQPEFSDGSDSSDDSDSNDGSQANIEFDSTYDSDIELMLDNTYDDKNDKDKDRQETPNPLWFRFLRSRVPAEYLAAQYAGQKRLPWTLAKNKRTKTDYMPAIKGKWWSDTAKEMAGLGSETRSDIARIMETELGEQLHGKDRCTSC
jgi:hypothetical protein